MSTCKEPPSLPLSLRSRTGSQPCQLRSFSCVPLSRKTNHPVCKLSLSSVLQRDLAMGLLTRSSQITQFHPVKTHCKSFLGDLSWKYTWQGRGRGIRRYRESHSLPAALGWQGARGSHGSRWTRLPRHRAGGAPVQGHLLKINNQGARSHGTATVSKSWPMPMVGWGVGGQGRLICSYRHT